MHEERKPVPRIHWSQQEPAGRLKAFLLGRCDDWLLSELDLNCSAFVCSSMCTVTDHHPWSASMLKRYITVNTSAEFIGEVCV